MQIRDYKLYKQTSFDAEEIDQKYFSKTFEELIKGSVIQNGNSLIFEFKDNKNFKIDEEFKYPQNPLSGDNSVSDPHIDYFLRCIDGRKYEYVYIANTQHKLLLPLCITPTDLVNKITDNKSNIKLELFNNSIEEIVTTKDLKESVLNNYTLCISD